MGSIFVMTTGMDGVSVLVMDHHTTGEAIIIGDQDGIIGGHIIIVHHTTIITTITDLTGHHTIEETVEQTMYQASPAPRPCGLISNLFLPT